MSHNSIERILVPVDLSETSLNALDTAVFLAKKYQAELQILNVSEKIPGGRNIEGQATFSKKPYPDVLPALQRAIGDTNGIKPGLLVKEGYVAETIISVAVSTKSDLIVMGTHGASGYRDGFIGSNCYTVIKHADCHVLTVPPAIRFTQSNNLLFPVRPVNGVLKQYKLVCNFMMEGSTLQILGLSNFSAERETGALNKLAGEIKYELEKGNVKNRTVWGKGISASADILHFMQIHSPDLIVLSTFLDGIVKPNYIGPHTQKIINTSRIPVLVIK
jgi:nucleotide-binding universal stress UspA family protein